jgi:3',5'-cyclic AMP phosphodiesterase CpdA
VSFLHRGPYSLHYESVNVANRLAPILEEHGVDLVFSGHDHRYSRALYRQGEYVPFSIASGLARGTAHLVPGLPANRDLNDYLSSEGTTYLVGNSSSVKLYDPRDDDETPMAFQYDEKNPVIPFVEITESAITVTSYVIESSGWMAFFPDSVSVLESFVIRR